MSKCKIEDCNKLTSGKSKYCHEHKKIAFENWKKIIAESEANKAHRERKFKEIFEEAFRLGRQAGEDAIPTPMVVQEHVNMADDNSPVKQSWLVRDGLCGFAWISIRPGNCASANFARKFWGGKTDSYYGGVTIWISDFNQSHARKKAMAGAIAHFLNEKLPAIDPKVQVWAMDRLD